MKINIEIPKFLLETVEVELPTYSNTLISMISNNARATRPESIGNLGQLKSEFKGETFEEFKKFILSKNPKMIETAVDKILNKAEQMELRPSYINYSTVKIWLENLIFIKTFRGLYIESLCFKTISEKYNLSFIKGTIEDDSKGIDGYLNNKPYNVKPSSYKNKYDKSTRVNCDIIFYTIKKNILEIEYDEI
jgi:hypothetical protein